MNTKQEPAMSGPFQLGMRSKEACDSLYEDNPELLACCADIENATAYLVECIRDGGRIYTCGNGGSAADAEHIVGELAKSFKLERAVDPSFAESYRELHKEEPPTYLEGAIAAFSLVSQPSFSTAFSNDRDARGVFAQQVYAYGRQGDTLVAISTSGNSANVVDAVKVALAKGMKVIALTGSRNSVLSELATVTIRVPDVRTYRIQELHIAVYHAICAMLEAEFFSYGPFHPEQRREAVILAGGFGTRLADAVPGVPKPMAPIAGRPFLRFLLDMLDEERFSHVVIADGYLREQIEEYFGDQYRNIRISYSNEDEPLGTGGAARKALMLCQSSEVFILNGDTFCKPDFDEMEKRFAHAGADIVMGVAHIDDAKRYGTVEISSNGIVRHFQEKTGVTKGHINAGVYLVSRTEFQNNGEAFSLEHDWLMHAAKRGLVSAVEIGGDFIDIGIPEDYERAQVLLSPLVRRWKLAMFDRDGTINIDTGHLHDPDDLVLIEPTTELIRDYNARDDWKVVVVTNQAGIAKGLYDEGAMVEVNNRLQDMLNANGVHVDAFYFCPHHPEYTGDCGCRKPAPGMLTHAIHDYDAVSQECVMYGDKESDMQAAAAAGVQGILV